MSFLIYNTREISELRLCIVALLHCCKLLTVKRTLKIHPC